MEINSRRKLRQFQKAIDIFFNQPELLERALTHPSYAAEHGGGKNHNQRLEFLGDAILSSVIADYLYQRYPDESEGKLTRMRAAAVCEPTLARLAEHLKLGSYLRLGRGEELSGGRRRPSNLADALEALTAAIFLDQGWDKARDFLHNLFKEEIEKTAEGLSLDYKTFLQEIIQQQGNGRLQYVILAESGPDHAKQFTSGVLWRGQMLGKGTGKSKKEAEQQAARAALEFLRNRTNPYL
ncbi:MAG: ribonuclease III [Bacillota bacterium]|jgi:ribonuclease-3|nr:ribonuclease III [Bacillota bacterium]